MGILKNETDPKRQQQLSEFISSYLTRVESIKATIKVNEDAAKRGTRNYHVAPSASPTSTSTAAGGSKAKHLHIEDLINEALGTGINRSAGGHKDHQGGSAGGTGGGNTDKNTDKTAPTAGEGATLTQVTAASLSEYEKSIMGDMLDSSPGVTWDDIAGNVTYAHG